MQTLYFTRYASPENLTGPTLFYFAFFALFSLFIWGAFSYLIWTAQRKEAAYLGQPAKKKWPGFVFGALFGLPLLIYFYMDAWGYFFSLRINNDKIYLDYFMPRRTVVLPINEIDAITAISETRKGVVYRLVFTVAGGQKYTSQMCDSETSRANRARLSQVLQRPIPPP